MKNKLYYIRSQRGFTLKDVSEQYFIHFGEKISPRKFGQIEEDKITVPVDIYYNLAEMFGPIKYLLSICVFYLRPLEFRPLRGSFA